MPDFAWNLFKISTKSDVCKGMCWTNMLEHHICFMGVHDFVSQMITSKGMFLSKLPRPSPTWNVLFVFFPFSHLFIIILIFLVSCRLFLFIVHDLNILPHHPLLHHPRHHHHHHHHHCRCCCRRHHCYYSYYSYDYSSYSYYSYYSYHLLLVVHLNHQHHPRIIHNIHLQMYLVVVLFH